MLYHHAHVAIGTAWLIPGHYFPWTAFQQEALAAGGTCLAGLAVVVTGRHWPVRLPLLAATALGLAAVPLLQFAGGMIPYVSDAVMPAAFLAAFAFAIGTGLQLARTSARFAGALLGCFFAAAAASVGLGLAQWLGLGPYGFLEVLDKEGRIYANLVQPNQFASLIGLGIAAVAWLYETRRIGGATASLAVAFLGFGAVSTQSRVAWLFVAFFVLMWLLYRRRLQLRTPPLAVAVMVVLFIVALIAWGPLNAWLQTDLAPKPLSSRTASGFRLTHWLTLSEALLQSPWLGYGWGQIPIAQQVTTLNHPPTFEFLISSHNLVLDLLLWNGLPIGLLVIGLCAWWYYTRMRQCKDAHQWGLLMVLGVLVAHSMVEFPLMYMFFLLPAGLLIGALDERMPPLPKMTVPVSIGRPAFATFTLAMAGFLYFTVTEYLEVEESVRRTRLWAAGYVQKGKSPTPPDVVLIDGPREYVRMWLNEARPGMTETELDWLHTVVSRTPSPPALMRYALAAGLNGRETEAERTLRLLCHLSLPRHCNEGRRAWAFHAERHPKLLAVPFPSTPERKTALAAR
jgi:O-antigen ligase